MKSGGDCKFVKIWRRIVGTPTGAMSEHVRKKSPRTRAVGQVIRVSLHQDSFLENRSPILQAKYRKAEEECPGLLELEHQTKHPDHLSEIERVADHRVWPPGDEFAGLRHQRK